jgi:hypothetical protein
MEIVFMSALLNQVTVQKLKDIIQDLNEIGGAETPEEYLEALLAMKDVLGEQIVNAHEIIRDIKQNVKAEPE